MARHCHGYQKCAGLGWAERWGLPRNLRPCGLGGYLQIVGFFIGLATVVYSTYSAGATGYKDLFGVKDDGSGEEPLPYRWVCGRGAGGGRVRVR
jgi:hypothetical protein